MDLQTKLVNDGYAQAHVSPETRSLPAWANWRDEVFSIGTDPIVMVYNTRKLDAARAPRTRRELLSLLQAPDQPLAGKISPYDVQGSGIGYLAATQDTRLDSMAGALLAALAGGGGNLAMGVAAFGQAAAINRQLGFSRAAAREADRAGFQMLTKAGYDAEGMSQMFSRLMNASRLNEGAGGGSWASTHPLSIERMSDVQNRVRSVPPSRHVDSDDFWYVRAKMRVVQGRDAVSLRSAGQQLQDEAQALSGVRQSAAYYGLALQAFQRNNLTEADRLWNLATAGGRNSAQLAKLSVDIALARKEYPRALELAQSATKRWPDQRALGIAYAQALQSNGRHAEAQDYLRAKIKQWGSDEPSLYQILAQSEERNGKPVQARRDEGPGLVEHHRQRHDEGGHHRDLDGHHERCDDARGDHARAFGQRGQHGRGQHVIDGGCAGVDEQYDEHGHHGAYGAQQAGAQFDQVRDEGLLLAFFLGGVLGHVGVPEGRVQSPGRGPDP
ncbi:hypothetical protein G6F57_014936 [Rhizopus arrhizus]|nr:hypothetical protein G6F57_014936 [Rhizopus arrhizus]